MKAGGDPSDHDDAWSIQSIRDWSMCCRLMELPRRLTFYFEAAVYEDVSINEKVFVVVMTSGSVSEARWDGHLSIDA